MSPSIAPPSMPPSSIPLSSKRVPASRRPPSRRSLRAPVGPARHPQVRSEPGQPVRSASTARRQRSVIARAVPTVRRSFVVEITPPEETSPDIVARIRPAPEAAAAAMKYGFRFSDAFLDVVAALLVEIAQEDDEGEGES